MHYSYSRDYELSGEESQVADDLSVAFATGMFLKIKKANRVPDLLSVVSVLSAFLIGTFNALDSMGVYKKFVPEGSNVRRTLAKSVLSSVAGHLDIDLRKLAEDSDFARRNRRPQNPDLN